MFSFKRFSSERMAWMYRGHPGGDLKAGVDRKCANQRKRGRNTMTFKLLPFSGILFIASLHTFPLKVSRHSYQKISCAKAHRPNQEKSSRGQDRTPAPTVILHQERASVCRPPANGASVLEYLYLWGRIWGSSMQQSELCLDIVLENLLLAKPVWLNG